MDWKILEYIADILEPMKQISQDLEGHHGNGTLYDIFPAMDNVVEYLEQAKQLYSDQDPRLKQAIELATAKLNKYYNLTDLNPILYAAIALHLSLTMDYFMYRWEQRSNWISKANSIINQMWNNFRDQYPLQSTTIGTIPNPSGSSLHSWKHKRGGQQPIDELKQYLSQASEEIENPVE
jgi:hypothetical protein